MAALHRELIRVTSFASRRECVCLWHIEAGVDEVGFGLKLLCWLRLELCFATRRPFSRPQFSSQYSLFGLNF